MTPEYLEELADEADPQKLWRLPMFDGLNLPSEQRRQLDAGIALRRYADHIRRLQDAREQLKSVLVVPLTANSSVIKTVATPMEYRARQRVDEL